ncbi:hypothetical protein E4T39_04666 [Aureobasidium subglaciale]|nr:hypothetical protein E4T39_04666 [Aureobasidium subglaciale]
MSTPPAHKRRRVDSGIHKPFVSPLKRIPSTAQATPASTRTAPTPSTPYTPLHSSSLRNISNATNTTHATPSSYDPEAVALQQEIKKLEHRIRDLRSQNGILLQASQINNVAPSCQQSTKPRLQRLEEKWRRASQSAAEEVFSDFSARIKDNGGYTTFLKQRANYKPFADVEEKEDQGDEDTWRDEMGDVLTERGKRQRRGEIEDRVKRQEDEAEEEGEEELTIGCMLQVLNIPAEVIGWDEKTQGWK